MSTVRAVTNDLLTADQAAEIAGVTRRTISRWAESGRLATAFRLPGDKGARLFHREDVASALDSPADEAGAA
jgi:excisionase family DNA binding protein